MTVCETYTTTTTTTSIHVTCSGANISTVASLVFANTNHTVRATVKVA